jgi:hypothetical protein
MQIMLYFVTDGVYLTQNLYIKHIDKIQSRH